MLPMFALFDLLDEFGPYEFRATGDEAIRFGADVNAFHAVVDLARKRVIERTVECGSTDHTEKIFLVRTAAVQHGYGLNAAAIEHLQARIQIEETAQRFIVNVELEEVMRER